MVDSRNRQRPTNAMKFAAVRANVIRLSKAGFVMAPAADRATRERRLEMQHLQEIEGNPLTADEIAMFEMFEREGWSHERREAYIIALLTRAASPEAAE